MVFKLFRRSEKGSVAPIFALSVIPLLAGVGLSVDYTSAVRTRSSMQDALDSAALSMVTLAKTMSLADKQTKLQGFYAANDGLGTATLNSYNVTSTGAVQVSASAIYQMPTTFTKLMAVTQVPIDVKTSVNKSPALVEANFNIDKVSGWWNKVMTLYGAKFGETANEPLMKIEYTYNNSGDPKGYGTTKVYKATGKDSKGNVTYSLSQQQICTTVTVSNFNNLPAGAITGTSGNKKYVTTCVTTNYEATSGATIDVSAMGNLYLEMKVPSGTPSTLESDDPNTSDRLFIDGVKKPKGKTVDIFNEVPCGQTSSQAWEDGGSVTNNTVTDADFFYKVTGRCDYSQRPSTTSLTQ